MHIVHTCDIEKWRLLMIAKKNSKNESKATQTQETSSCDCKTSPTPPITSSPASKTCCSSSTTKKNCDSNSKSQKEPTKIVVQYDVGFNNQLFIRGEGPSLSWDKGSVLKNVKPNEWVWESDADFKTCEFKVLINDQVYESGDNHSCKKGTTFSYTPVF